MNEQSPPRTHPDGGLRSWRPRRRAVLTVGLVGLLVGGAVTVFSLQEGRGHAEPIATQPVQRGWGLYLGSVSGVTVGIATNGRTVQAFARNADAKEVSWFDGLLAGNSFDITAANGSVLAGGVVAGNAHGRYVTPSGAVVPFDVPAPVAQGALYRGAVIGADGARVEAGWVVSDSGTVTGGIVVTNPRGLKSGPTKPTTAAFLTTAGSVDTGSGIVPLRRVKPDTLDQPVPTALTGAALGNQTGRNVKDDFTKSVKVANIPEPAKPSGAAITAQLSGPTVVDQGKPFEVKLSLANPDPVAVDGAAIDLAFPAAFAMGDRPDEAIPKGCLDNKVREATTVADEEVTPNGSQLIGRNITLPPGGTCDLTIDLIANVGGVYEFVTSPTRAPGRPAGASGRLTVTVAPPKTSATAGDPAAVPNGICAAPSSSPDGPKTVVSNVSLGVSPLPVRLATTGFSQVTSWTMKFSDGTPSISCRGAPPATIPHTFINFADPSTADPVVFTAELTAVSKGATIGPFRVLVEVYPRLKEGKSKRVATLVSPTNEVFVRGTFSAATVEILNAGDEDLKPGLTKVTVSIVSDPATIVQATLESTTGPWTCTSNVSCQFNGPIGRYSSPPPLRLNVGVPATGPQAYKVTAVVDAVTNASNSATTVERTAVIPVDGIIARASAGGVLRPLDSGTFMPLSNPLGAIGAKSAPKSPTLPPPPQFPSLTLNEAGQLVPTVVTLDGRASIHGQRPTTYKWEQVRGPTDPVVTLDNNGRAVTDTFSAPIVLVSTDLVFKLTVDDKVRSDDDTITIKITPINRAPIIRLDTAKKATTGELLPDKGKAFTFGFTAADPDREAITTTWKIDTPVPPGAVVVNGTKLTIPRWPITGAPQVVAIATATDSRLMVTTKTVLIGVKPVPPSLTVTGPAGVLPGGQAQIHVDDSTGTTTAFVWELADGSAPASIENTTGDTTSVSVDAGALPGTAVAIRVHPKDLPGPVALLEITVLPAPVTLAVPTISIPDASCTEVTIDAFPAIPLPGDFEFVSGSASNCDGIVHVVADANGPGSSTVHLDGTRFPDGFAGSLRIIGFPLLGGVVSTETPDPTDDDAAAVDTRNGGFVRVPIAVANPEIIPGLNLASVEVVVSAGGLAVHAEARIGDPTHAFDVDIDGTLAQGGTFALAVTAKTTGPVTLHPLLPDIESGSFLGSLDWDGSALHFRLSASVGGSWKPLGSLITITGLRVEFGNVDPPKSCPTTTDGLFLAVAGTATVDASLTPDPVALSVEGCLGLPGDGGSGAGNLEPFFRIDGDADGSWRPITGVDLVVKNVGITIEYVNQHLNLDVHGTANILGLDVQVSARVVNSAFVVIASADLRPILGIPLDNALLAVATAQVDNFDVDLDGDPGTGPQVTLPQGITAIATMQVPNVDLLNNVLNPENKPLDGPDPPPQVAADLLFLANVSDAGITLKAHVDLGAGLTLLKLCSAGVFSQCDGMLDATTELHLTGFELGLAVGAGGFEISASVLGTLLLPKREQADPPTSTIPDPPCQTCPRVRDLLEIGATVFVAPPVVGFSMFVISDWVDPFGITGFAITKAALQVSLDFTTLPPAGPIPSIGILLETRGLPDLFDNVLHSQRDETVRLAVNISKTAPIFEITLGDHDSNTFLKPHDSLEIDDASLVIAPLGGSIGPFTYTKGIHLSFGGKIFSLVVDGTFDLTIVPPKIVGHLDVGALPLGPLTIEQTVVDVVIDPTAPAFCAHVRGGVAIARGGPQFTADFTFLAGPGSCGNEFAPPPANGVAISGDITAENWTLAPGVKLTTVDVHVDFAGIADPTAEFDVDASANVMGFQPAVKGSLRFANGIVDRFSLSIDVGVAAVPIGPISLKCTNGPCLTINYDANAQPRVQVQVRGKIEMDTTGTSVAIDGVLDTTHVALTAVLSASSVLDKISLSGELFLANSDPDARIINAAGQSVIAHQGDFRLSAKTVDPIKLGSTTAQWVFAAGRADGAYYLNGSADLQVFAATAHVSGDFKVSGGKLGFHVEGKSGGEVDTAKVNLFGPENGIQRGAIRTAFASAGNYDDPPADDAKLVFRADYKFKVILDSATGLSVSADGSTSLRYVEYHNGDAEKRSKQTKLSDGTLKFDSNTGRFCYEVTIAAFMFKAGGC